MAGRTVRKLPSSIRMNVGSPCEKRITQFRSDLKNPSRPMSTFASTSFPSASFHFGCFDRENAAPVSDEVRERDERRSTRLVEDRELTVPERKDAGQLTRPVAGLHQNPNVIEGHGRRR